MFDDICFDLVYSTLLTMYYSKALLLSAQAQQPLHCTALHCHSCHMPPDRDILAHLHSSHPNVRTRKDDLVSKLQFFITLR